MDMITQAENISYSNYKNGSNTEMNSFEDFCGGVFWNTSLTWDTDQPNFTKCFQNTVVYWIPCFFLWLFSPYEISLIRNSTALPHRRTWFNISKGVFVIIHLIISLLDTFYGTGKGETKSQVLSPLIQVITLVMIFIFIELERKKGVITSGVLLFFWLFSLLMDIIPLYSFIIGKITQGEFSNDVHFAFLVVKMICSLFEFLLFCFSEVQDKTLLSKDVCPEKRASFLSKIFFNYMGSLVYQGYKRDLVESDVWGLMDEDKVEQLAPVICNNWNQELYRCNKLPNHIAEKVLPRDKRYSDAESTPLAHKSKSYSSVPERTKGKIKEPSFFWVLVKTFGWEILMAILTRAVYDVLIFVGPEIQSQLINFAEDSSVQQWKGWIFASLYIVNSVIASAFFHRTFHISLKSGMRIKSAVTAMVFKKALTMSNDAKKSVTVGEIVNIMSVDAQRLQDVFGVLWMVTSAPLEIVIAMVMLWRVVGPSSMAGLAVMVCLVPVNGLLATKQRKLQIAQMKNKDNRIKIMSEILNGMKVLKLYAWELSFKEKVDAIRNIEVKTLKIFSYFSSVGVFFWTCAPFLVTIATFTCYILTGNNFTSETAFVSLSLFNLLRIPLNLLPMIISYLITAAVSIKRIGKFLQSKDLNDMDITHETNSKCPISIKNGTFAWGSDKEDLPVLSNVNLEVEEGELIAIIGNVGSGKSSLISAMLGEMEKRSGNVNTRGSIAYVAQQAWMMNVTLKNNILFEKPYSEKRYQKVINTCSLQPDLDILPGGDSTEIGEKGINLSGGQKQRISLARAVYNDADVYLFDDPLSAVDSHVGKDIFEKVMDNTTGILRGKTRVLVTHGLQWLPKVDRIVCVEDGSIKEVGTYDELLAKDGFLAHMIKNFLISNINADSEDEEHVNEVKKQILERLESLPDESNTKDLITQLSVAGTDPSTILRHLSKNTSVEESSLVRSLRRRKSSGMERSLSTSYNRSLSRQKSHLKSLKEEKPSEKNEPKGSKLIADETQMSGEVGWKVYVSYFKAMGYINTIGILCLFVTYQTMNVISNIWLSYWSEDERLLNSTSPEEDKSINYQYLGVYAALGVVQAICVLGYALACAFSMVMASAHMHERMLSNILKSPMSFFDTTPSGRLLNRFSRDVETTDNQLPMIIRNWMNTFFSAISILCVIIYSTPLFAVVVVPLACFYYFLQKYYIPTARQLKRLESTTRSPIYSHFSETIVGASTIRAYKMDKVFIDKSETLVDHNQTFYYSNNSSNRWLGYRLEILSSMVVFSAALFGVLGRGSVSGGVIGLSLSYAMQITGTLNWFIRNNADLETNIVSVERLKEYSETQTEADWYIDQTKPSPQWPTSGQITFDEYSTRYRPDLDLVVRNINIEIEAGQKVGIVGRTGAGKSSLTLALFRLIEAAGGSISIDKLNIAELGLHQLRSRITILPQDPVLFSGSLRMNLDPFDKHSDEAIWTSIKRSHLGPFVEKLPTRLKHECGEGGMNLSVGQRQLVCLARTLLKKTKVLILDEATAAVDLETDELIQATIRKEFMDCTILTIAHRLNTIMDSDKVLVLDAGRVKEFDAPHKLLQDKNTIFYGMARDAGLI